MSTDDWCDTCKFGDLHYKDKPCCDCIYGVDGDVISTNQYIEKHYSAIQLSNKLAAEEMEIQRKVASKHKIKDFQLLGVSIVKDPIYEDAMIKTIVVNKTKEDFDVYIGRGSKWGNPFIIGISGSRLEVIAMYREYITASEGLIYDLKELKGKRLGCYCKPLPCHGDVLKELVDEI